MKLFCSFFLTLISIEFSYAQCPCTNPGAELIANGNFNSGNSGFSSDYYYQTDNGNSSEHEYGIETNTSASYGLERDCGDHTTGTGKYMWIEPVDLSNYWNGYLAWEKTVSVSKNTTYLFTLWSATIGFYQADVMVLIDGDTVLPDFKTPYVDPSDDCIWGKKCVTWNSGNAVQAQIQIIPWFGNLASTKIAIDDISFHSCNALSAIEEIDNSIISVTPNPSSGVINLHISYPDIILRLSLTNLTGNTVIDNGLSHSSNDGDIELDCTSLASGLYFLKVVTLKKIYVSKVSIQKL